MIPIVHWVWDGRAACGHPTAGSSLHRLASNLELVTCAHCLDVWALQ